MTTTSGPSSEAATYGIVEALDDVLAEPLGDTLILVTAFVVEKAKLEAEYDDLTDIPEPLQSFLAGIFKTGDAVEALIRGGLSQ